MYRFTVSFFCLACLAGLSNAQIVEIPDTAFLYALIDNGVDVNEDSLISHAEAEAVTYLDVVGLVGRPPMVKGEIKSLTGIEAFINLEELYCMGNQISSLDVSNNTELKNLSCSYNQLTTLDVSSNTALTELYCNWNQLTSLDVSSCIALMWMFCSNNKLTTLDISYNTSLGLVLGSHALTLAKMPTLHEVCVWTKPFPPDYLGIDITGSPNVYFTTECTNGLKDYMKSNFIIYPNPVNDILSVETNMQGQHTVELYLLGGQMIFSTKMKGPILQINLSTFRKGVYLIRVSSRDQVWTEKIARL